MSPGTDRSPQILVLQHVAQEPPSGIADAIEAAGGRTQVVRVDAGAPVPASIEGQAGLVVMGGPMGVYEMDRYPHLRSELRLIEDALARGVPVLGICLGSQLLAAALGARVRPGPQKEIGWYPVLLEPPAAEDRLFAGTPASFQALHWHGDVFDLPAGAVPLARSRMTAVQAFRSGASAYGILFHPEVTGPQLAGMGAAFAGELAQTGIAPADLLQGWSTHGAALQAVGEHLFGRWMGLSR